MNAKELSMRMAENAEEIVRFLLPAGKRAGNEWKVGNTSGEAGTSMSVRIKGGKAGVWSDFSNGESGDLLDLWCATRGLSIADAMQEAMQHLGIYENRPEKPRKEYARPQKPKCHKAKSAAREWLSSRGIEDRTIEAFQIGEYQRGGNTYAVFPYIREGEFINAKHRNIADKKDMRQEGGAEPCLYGWHLIPPSARSVTLVEGEIDCLTLHQWGFPALSVNAGAGNHQWIENDWDRLERFSTIYICFDSDEAGQKGAKEVINRLGIERCKLVSLPVKDANDWLLQGACGEDFIHCQQEARTLDPEELRPISDFVNEVLASFYPAPDDKPAPSLQVDQKLQWLRFRPSEVTVWSGYNGHGKSLFLSQVVLGLMEQGERAVVFSGEMRAHQQLKRMVKQATGLDRPTQAYIRHVAEWLSDRCWVFDLLGSAKLDRLLEVFAYAAKRYGCNQFVIDSIMTLDVPDDGPKAITAQKEAISKICQFARQFNVHVHVVAHPRKGLDEKQKPGKMDVAGAGHLTNAVDNVCIVWRSWKDASKPDDGSRDAEFDLHKQRHGETQTRTHTMWFNRDSQQYRSQSQPMTFGYVPYEQNAEAVNAGF